MIRMFHWLSRSGLVPLKDGVIEVRSLNRIPAIVNITSGMVIEEINLLLEREFPGKDLLTAWIVMES